MTQIPLFPLNVVLFPGGIVPLRIFETRYMDMARGCLRDNSPFGVCLIARGHEVGDTATPSAVGCVAQIDVWDMPQLGVLHVRAIGRDRFRIKSTTRQADGLLTGTVESIAPDEDAPIITAHRGCADLLRRIIDDLEAKALERADAEASGPSAPAVDAMPFPMPYHLESSVWVGNRLCEVLPIPLKAKQRLMELDDARTRLDIVAKYLKQHDVLK